MPDSLAVTGPTGLALLCAGNGAAGSVDKTVFVSDDLGAHWSSRRHLRRAAATRMRCRPGLLSQLVVAAASGASMLYYSS